jgi:hypothetical protein
MTDPSDHDEAISVITMAEMRKQEEARHRNATRPRLVHVEALQALALEARCWDGAAAMESSALARGPVSPAGRVPPRTIST